MVASVCSPSAVSLTFSCRFASILPPARRPVAKRGSRRGFPRHPGDSALPVRGNVIAPQPDSPQLAGGVSGILPGDVVGWLVASSCLVYEEAQDPSRRL